MHPGLNAWTFPPGTAPDEQIQLAAAAGFAALELVVGADGPLTPETPTGQFTELATRAADAGVTITSLATGLFWETNYASPSPNDRRRAIELTLIMLDQAAAAQAGAMLVVPALVGKLGDAHGQVSYADALHRSIDALNDLRHDAEARGVIIGIENVWNRFLLSPLEAASFIDEVNSPYVGFYLDVGNVLAYGYPEDWIATLGGRICRIHAKDYDVSKPGWDGFCGLGAGSVDWPAVVAALQAIGYDGPLTYEGSGEPADICRRLTDILTSATA